MKGTGSDDDATKEDKAVGGVEADANAGIFHRKEDIREYMCFAGILPGKNTVAFI
ncbi:MAG: hypothetical protein GX811_13225 [Lentisphaerae bacterium]|nr:hypothetical protein [Lentisphaerota bacterium]